MAFYQSTDQVYVVLGQLFDRMQAESTQLDQFAKSSLVIRINLADPLAEILVDGRHPKVFFGARPGRADLELNMSADLLHQIWLGERSLRESFFGGQIKTKGNVFKAMALGDLFREAEHFYPLILQEAGLR